MESVYLETTFISYLVARPSRDLHVAAHQLYFPRSSNNQAAHSSRRVTSS